MTEVLSLFEPGAVLPDVRFPAVTRAMLALFAGASGDHNPVHIDSDHAQAAGFDDVFAHGMLSMAWCGRALESWVGPLGLRDFGVRFRQMTHIGDVLVCRATVRAVAGGVAELDLSLVRTDGTVTVSGHATVVVDAAAEKEKTLR